MTEPTAYKTRGNRVYVTIPPEVRFMRLVDQNGPNGCWLWKGWITAIGYGQFGFNGKMISAHRFWALRDGILKPGEEVCHRCDVPRCVNPAHLFIASHAENMADAAAKGRLCSIKAEIPADTLAFINAFRGIPGASRTLSQEFGLNWERIRSEWAKCDQTQPLEKAA